MIKQVVNFEKARARMVDEQLVPRGIKDLMVLKAMSEVPRDLFVDEALQSQAYGDFPLPIGEGQTISQPYIVALMTQALHLAGHEFVLEIGTGSGYQAAILSQICTKVFTIERLKPLFLRARKLFDQLHYTNIVARADDGTIGWPEFAPFDAIIITAAGPKVPEPLVEQLADPGILIIPVGDRWIQDLVLVSKKEGQIREQKLDAVRFVSLVGAFGWPE